MWTNTELVAGRDMFLQLLCFQQICFYFFAEPSDEEIKLLILIKMKAVNQ